MSKLGFSVYAIIRKPVARVFQAVHDPKKLSKYFTTGGASAPLDAGEVVYWDFADFPGKFPVKVKAMQKNKRIVIAWKAGDGNYDTRVEVSEK